MSRRKALLLCTGTATFAIVTFAGAFPSSVRMNSQTDARIVYHVLTNEDQALRNMENGLSTTVTVDSESGHFIAPDSPILPSVTRFVEIRPGSKPSILVHSRYVTRFSAGNLPSTYNFAKDKIETLNVTNGSGVYPRQLFSVGEVVSFRGRTLLPVTVYPIHYDASAHEYIFHSNIEVILEGDFQPALSRQSSAGSTVFQKVVSPLIGGIPPRDDISPNHPVGSYLVVVREECLPYAIPLLEWKRQAGYEVKVLRYPAQATAEAVKADILAFYDAAVDSGEEPFEYLLIIGDREQNHGQAAWTFPSFDGEPSMPGAAAHADYIYGLLDDPDDPVMDVAVGRMASGSPERMELAVNRQLAYEKSPNLDNPEWFVRCGVFSQYWGDEPINYDQFYAVRWGEQTLQNMGFPEVLRYESFVGDQDGGDRQITEEMAGWLNRGLNVWIGRAQISGWENRLAGVNVNQNRIFPYGINVTGHGEFTGEWLYGDGDGENLKGAVIWTTGWGQPATVFSNGVWQTLVSGVLNRDLPIGWARALIGLEWEARFPNGAASRGIYQTDVDLYGDPGLQPWTAVPKRVQITRDQEISFGDNYLTVRVTEAGGDDPAQGVTVTLYSPGNLPDPEDYPDHEPLLQMTGRTDAWGRASFDIEDGLPEGRLFITATGRNICPVWEQLNLQQDDPPNLVVESVRIVEGAARAGSQFSIRLTVRNNGGSAAESVNGLAESFSACAQIGDEQINFGNIAAGEFAENNRDLRVTFQSNAPDGYTPELIIFLTYRGQGDTSTSLIRIEVLAPTLSVENIEPEYRLGSEIVLEPRLFNSGRVEYQGGACTLLSEDWRLNVIDGSVRYGRIDPGQARPSINGDQFIVRAKPGAIAGPDAKLMMIVRVGNVNVVDTLSISFALSSDADRPGPEPADAYGYTCLDNRDSAWVRFPFDNWDEIYPQAHDAYAQGVLLPVRGAVNVAAVVPLDFPFQFYGQTYDSITVCSNGFISVGSQPRQVNYENVRLEMATGGAAGMIAPFWDRLTLQPYQQRPNGIYTYYDTTFHRFIIEWYELHPYNSLPTSLNFQVQILDSRYYSTVTGDCPIIFNYNNITNVLDVADAVQFASVGISSPDGAGGLGVNFDSSGTAYTPVVRSRTQLMFTTTPKSTTESLGSVMGIVTDPDHRPFSGEPVSITAYGLGTLWQTVTDRDGEFTFEEVLPGNYRLEVTHARHNPVRRAITVEPGGNLGERIEITHPEIFFSYPYSGRPYLEQRDSLRSPPPPITVTRPIYVRNRGNGPLNYFTSVINDPPGGRNDWFDINWGRSGVIQAGEIKALIAVVTTYNLQIRDNIDTTYFGFLYISDTTSGISMRLPLSLYLNPNNDVLEDGTWQPWSWSLKENYPNPFNSSTRIDYSVAEMVDTKLNLFDTQGRLVRTLVDERATPGEYSIALEAGDLPPGLYLLRMEAGVFRETRKMVLVK